MKMNRILAIGIGVLVLAVVAVGAVGASVVFAQDEEQAGTDPWWPPLRKLRGIDFKALLAEALGITTDELESAHEQAREMALEQALDEGIITQEQVDQMQTRKELATYIHRQAILAQALGMTEEELKEALAETGNLMDLMEERGLDPDEVYEAVREGFADALAEAVADGVITQEQADKILSAETLRGLLEWQLRGRRRMPRHRRFPGLRDREGFEGRWRDLSEDDANTDTRFGFPTWIPEASDSDL